jgi:phosphoglycolate phosphatase-like HAD superfamily hydrolase
VASITDTRHLARMSTPVRQILEHRIALLFQCRHVTAGAMHALQKVNLEQAAAAADALRWMHPTRVDPQQPRYQGASSLWYWQPLTLSADLHPIAGAILSDAAGPEASEPSPGCYELSEQGQNLFCGRYRGALISEGAIEPPHRPAKSELLLYLGPVSAKRLGIEADAPMRLKIERVTLLPFKTGFGLIIFEMSVRPHDHAFLTADQLVEAVHLLADERREAALRWPPGSADDHGTGFKLSTLLQASLAGTGIDVLRGERVYTYTTVVLHGAMPPDLRREFALRLSRHYNRGYTPELDNGDTEFLAPFQNVLHAASLEGIATLVAIDGSATSPVEAPEFLKNWLKTAYAPGYLPLAAVAYHEYVVLLGLAQSAAVDLDFAHFDARLADKLERLCQRFLAFRLRYRPVQLSRISMHNRFSETLRRSLGSQTLSSKAAEDAAEAEQRLAAFGARLKQEAEEHRERRWAWHTAVLEVALAFLAILGLFKQAGELLESMQTAHWHFGALTGRNKVELVGYLAALLIGGLQIVRYRSAEKEKRGIGGMPVQRGKDIACDAGLES